MFACETGWMNRTEKRRTGEMSKTSASESRELVYVQVGAAAVRRARVHLVMTLEGVIQVSGARCMHGMGCLAEKHLIVIVGQAQKQI